MAFLNTNVRIGLKINSETIDINELFKKLDLKQLLYEIVINNEKYDKFVEIDPSKLTINPKPELSR